MMIHKSSHEIHWIQSKRNMKGKRDMKWPYTYLEHFKIAIDVNGNISSPILWKTYLFPHQKTSLGSWNFFFLVFRLIVLFPLLKTGPFLHKLLPNQTSPCSNFLNYSLILNWILSLKKASFGLLPFGPVYFAISIW